MYRISIISSTTVKFFLKQPYAYIILFVCSLLIWVSPDCALFAFGDELRLATETCFSTILLGSLVLSLLTSAASIQEELDNRTLLTLISKPMPRSEFILGKYLGTLTILFISMLFLYIVFCTMAEVRTLETPTQRMLKITLTKAQTLGMVLLFMQAAIVLAFSVLIAPYLSTPLNLCFSLSFMVLANISHILENIITESSGLFAFLLKIGFYFIPDFTIYNLGDLLAKNENIPDLFNYTIVAALYSFCFLTILLSLAILLFKKKEI